MRLEIIKEIKLTGIGLKKIGDSVDIEDSSGSILVRMGFGKESFISKIDKEDAELDALIESEEKEKKKRVRRTKAEIESDKNK